MIIGGLIGLISAPIWEAIKKALVGVPPSQPPIGEARLKMGLLDTAIGGGGLYATLYTDWGKKRTPMDKGFLYVFCTFTLISGLVYLLTPSPAKKMGEVLRKEIAFS